MRMLELTTCYSADIVTWWQVLFQDNPSSGFIRVLPPNVAKPPGASSICMSALSRINYPSGVVFGAGTGQ